MLARVLREIPKLTDAVVRADVDGKPSYDLGPSRDAVATRRGHEAPRATAKATKRTARQARKVPGVAQAEGQVKGAVASEADLAIARYDTLTADEIIARLPELSQIDLAKVDSYERRHAEPHARSSSRIDHAARRRAVARLRRADRRRGPVRRCPRATTSASSRCARTSASHKNRAGVLKAAEREPHAAPNPSSHEHRRQGPQDPRRRRRRRRRRPAPSRPRTTCRSPTTTSRPPTSIAAKLNGFSQRELRMIGAYEAKHENRATITDRIAELTGEEPWSGYDEQTVDVDHVARSPTPTPRRRARWSPTSAITSRARRVIDRAKQRAAN